MTLSSRTAWISTLLALFMVFILPVCWAGALERARSVAGQPPSTANNNEEERHEDEEAELELAESHAAPPQSQRRVRAIRRVHVLAAIVPVLRASVAAVAEPSVLSVRRLI